MADLGTLITLPSTKIPWAVFGYPCYQQGEVFNTKVHGKRYVKELLANPQTVSGFMALTHNSMKRIWGNQVYNFPVIGSVYRGKKHVSLVIPFWVYDTFVPIQFGNSINEISGSGVISGTVKVEGVVRSNMIVRLYYKRNGRLIANTLTNEDGEFTFVGLEAGKANYTVLAFDSEEGFNAVTMDSIVPDGFFWPTPIFPIYAAPLSYIAYYPPAFNFTYSKQSSEYNASYSCFYALDPTKSLTGSNIESCWASSYSGTIPPQRLNIDYVAPFIPRRMYIENFVSSGGFTDQGVHNVSLYGSNSATAFTTTTPTDLTDLTLLGSFTINPHIAQDIPDPKYFAFNCTIPYRYYALIMHDMPARTYNYMGVRRLEIHGASQINISDTVGSLSLWLDPSDLSSVTTDTNGINRISDKSGNNRNALQGTDSRKPALLIGGLNGLSCINFVGTTKRLDIQNPSSATQNVFMVMKPNADNEWLMLGSMSPSYYALCGGTATGNPTSSGGLASMFVNGTDLGNPERTTFRNAIGSNASLIGAMMQIFTGYSSMTISNYGDSYPQFDYQGLVGEIIMSTTALSVANREKIEGYLAWKWGLVASLPSGHTYKNAMP